MGGEGRRDARVAPSGNQSQSRHVPVLLHSRCGMRASKRRVFLSSGVGDAFLR